MKKIIFTIKPIEYTSKKTGQVSQATSINLGVEGVDTTIEWIDFKTKIFMPDTTMINPNDVDLNAEHLKINGYSVPWNYVYGVKQVVKYALEK